MGRCRARVGRKSSREAALAIVVSLPGLMQASCTRFSDPIYDESQGTPTSASNENLGVVDAASPKLVFQDEFEGSSLDRSHWNTDWWFGRIKNDDLSYFAEESISVSSGSLHIRSSKTAASGRDYTSGIVTTYQKLSVTYGAFEIRAKGPKGLGRLDFHLLAESTQWPPEIGIVGTDTARSDRVQFWLSPAPSDGGSTFTDAGAGAGIGASADRFQVTSQPGADFSADFHIYRANWAPGLLIWSLDGAEQFRTTLGIPNDEMYVAVSVELGPANVADAIAAQSEAEIEYVRVYQTQ